MKVYLLQERDLERLTEMIDRDPRYGQTGGSSVVFSEEQRAAFVEAHRFFNYQVREWIEFVKREA